MCGTDMQPQLYNKIIGDYRPEKLLYSLSRGEFAPWQAFGGKRILTAFFKNLLIKTVNFRSQLKMYGPNSD